MDDKTLIAMRVAQELKNGNLLTFGTGRPTRGPPFLPPAAQVFFQSENGVIGMQPLTDPDLMLGDLTDAGGTPTSLEPGAMAFDSVASFGFIRGGHLDVTVLGGL